MKNLLTTLALTFGLLFGGLVAPAHAATVVNVGSFVVPDPSLSGCDMGNGIRLVGFEGVDWQVDGDPIEVTPQGSTLWLPNGFDGTVTAVAQPGYELHEIATQRSGETLSWHHVVLPLGRACSGLVTCDQTANDHRAQLAAANARVERLQRIADRRADTIQRLRAKIRALR